MDIQGLCGNCERLCQTDDKAIALKCFQSFCFHSTLYVDSKDVENGVLSYKNSYVVKGNAEFTIKGVKVG